MLQRQEDSGAHAPTGQSFADWRRLTHRGTHSTTSTATWPPIPSSRRRPAIDAGTNQEPSVERKTQR